MLRAAKRPVRDTSILSQVDFIEINWSPYRKREGCRYDICKTQSFTSVSRNLKCYCQMRCLFLCLLSLRENFGSVGNGFFCSWHCIILLGAENPDGSLCFLHRDSMLIISLSTFLTEHNRQPNSAHAPVGRMQGLWLKISRMPPPPQNLTHTPSTSPPIPQKTENSHTSTLNRVLCLQNLSL